MGMTFPQINLNMTSEHDNRFWTPETFESVSAACRETGFLNVGITSTHNSMRETMRKRSNGFVYHFRWGEPNAPPKPKVWVVLKTYSKCLTTLTFKDRKACFRMDAGFDSNLLQFGTLTKLSR